MTFIAPGRATERGHALRVTIRDPTRSGQRPIAFSAELRRKMLGEVTHVAVDLNEKTRTITFLPSGPVFKGHPAHELKPDGGGKKTGQCVFFNVPAAKRIEHIPSARYEVEVLEDRFKIRWEEKEEFDGDRRTR